MATVRVLILRAPGTNCDGETGYAFELAGAQPTRVHVNALLEAPQLLGGYQVLVIPGGFSYGDDVSAGKILANQLCTALGHHLRRFRDSGRLILGICNGFQVLIKSGLLPGWDDRGEAAGQPATLAHNDSGKFEDRWIHLAANPACCPFLQGIASLDLPVAHGEGKFVCRDASVLERLHSNSQIVLRYSRPDPVSGQPAAISNHQPAIKEQLLPYPVNPNGSQANIAGICDPTGHVLGLMPHPERHIEHTHHPHWTRRKPVSEGDGLALFRNAVRYFAS